MTTAALVLAAGRGSRMRAAGEAALSPEQAEAAARGHKAMMPIAGRPFLDYVLTGLADAGVKDIAVVFGPAHDEARAYYRALRLTRIRLTPLLQPEPRGTADAVLAAEQWSDGKPFITLNGDNLYPGEPIERLRDAEGPALAGFERSSLGLPVDRVAAFALIEADARGCLSRIVEKPGDAAVDAAGPNAMVSMNLWRFDARVFDACRDVPASERGEHELPQAVALASARGVCFDVIPVRGEVLDLSRREDVARVARAVAPSEARL